ncbi:hypothetical protein MRX96_049571 [Rhipicephalus microplus]
MTRPTPTLPSGPKLASVARDARYGRRTEKTWLMGLCFEVWLHADTEAGSVRERPFKTRTELVKIRLPSARYGISDSGENPCLSIGRCTWIVPWVRALRIQHRSASDKKS